MRPKVGRSGIGDALGASDGAAVAVGVGAGSRADAGLRRPRQQVEADDADDHDGRRRGHDLEGCVHEGGPPRLPAMAALWGRGELGEHRIEDAVREIRDAILQPRPDDAGGVAFGVHWATSHATGWASASSAARSPRIA